MGNVLYLVKGQSPERPAAASSREERHPAPAVAGGEPREEVPREQHGVLADVADFLYASIDTHFREAGALRRHRAPAEIAKEAVDEALEALDELARDRTVRI